MTSRYQDPSAAAVFQALGGTRTPRGYLCRCPVPSHGQGRGDRNPSVLVSDGPKHLSVTCFAGCDWREVRDAIRGLDLSRDPLPVAYEPPPPRTTSEQALGLWAEARPIGNTLAAAYAATRGLPVPPPSLRFLPDAPYAPAREEPYRPARLLPALLAAMQDVERNIVAVQMTFLTPRGPNGPDKADVKTPRRIIGPARGAALRLGPAAETIGLAEGYENGHAAMLMHGVPTWCALGAERMPMVRFPPIVKRLLIFADPDAPGLKAAEATRQANPGLTVEIVPPPGAEDYAEHYRRQGGASLDIGRLGEVALS